MHWKVLVSAPYMQPVVDDFRPFFNENKIEIVVPKITERLEEDELLDLIGDIDGVICGDDRFTRRVMEKAKKLKVIAKWGTGIDSIDKEAAKEFNIAVYNTPNAFTCPVADSVLGYILSFARQIPWSTQAMRKGVWSKTPCVTLGECTLGVIGVGNIGKAVIKRALAFGMKVFGNDIADVSASFIQATGVVMMPKEELLGKSDFVSINCDLNPTSFHLMGEKEFGRMKPTAYIVNTARGPIIEEKALVKALREKHIAGAAMDVFEEEPLPQDSPLREMDNCLLAPHNANSSPMAWAYVHENTLKNLLRGLTGKG